MASKVEELRGTACNCCNGRVGRRLLELVEEKRELKQYVIPTGVELLKVAKTAGMKFAEACNCCNGRVGKQPMEELISILGGA